MRKSKYAGGLQYTVLTSQAPVREKGNETLCGLILHTAST